MGDLSDVPLVGQALAVLGSGLDLMLNGGEIVLGLITWIVTHAASILPVLSVLNRLGERIPTLPTVPGWVISLALAALLTTYTLRLIASQKS